MRYVDPDTTKRLTFLTNNFTVPAVAIPQLYNSRRHVELFFRWIKQYLRIKAFYGTSENATPADSERHAFRENAHFYAAFALRVDEVHRFGRCRSGGRPQLRLVMSHRMSVVPTVALRKVCVEAHPVSGRPAAGLFPETSPRFADSR